MCSFLLPRVLLILEQSMTETLRSKRVIELPTLHQVQCDVRFYRFGLYLLVENASRLDSAVDEVLMSTSDRCVGPVPASPSVCVLFGDTYIYVCVCA